jgi:TRAP-type mannitol/chloroaromatic compound transport system permease small subunit
VSLLRSIDHTLAAVTAAAQWLVLPVSLLLFAQWPLRELLHAYAIQANDLAQWIFALYVGAALTFATRQRTHLAADALAQRYSPRTRERIARLGGFLAIAPWSLFFLVVAAPAVWQSVTSLERFPETYDAGYFLIKAASWLLALLALLQSIVGLARADSSG